MKKETMKLAILSLSIAAACGSAMAADNSTDANRSTATKESTAVKQKVAGVDAKVAPNLNRASKVIGTNVEDTKGDKIGDVKDIVLDRSNGQIAYAVVSAGGWLGIGDKYFAVPWKSLQAANDNKYILNVTKEQMKKAQGFDKDHWPDMANDQWNRENAKVFNAQPYSERQASNHHRHHGETSTGSSDASNSNAGADNKSNEK